MKSKVEYIEDIISSLRQLDPYRIILFGSHSTETYGEESDIDFLVILDSNSISTTYEEKMMNKLMVRNKIIEINRRIPIDLVVYTKAEYEIIERNGSSFLNEIRNTGKTLYEKAS